jgi:hypothetical protein
MAVIFAALSVQDFIDKIGAYAGFAAAIGLALFALLLFSQARELKRLREWGAQTHDRIGELERRLAAALELARRASTSQRTMAPGTGPVAAQRTGGPASPAPRPAARPAVARTSSPTRLPLLPTAPVRVAGAALGSATMVVPLPKHPPGVAPAAAPAPATSVPTSVSAAPSKPPVAPATPPTGPATIPAAAAASAVAPAPSAPAPATAAAQGPAQPAPAPPAAATPAGTNGHSDTFPPVPPIRRTPPGGARPGAGRRLPPRGPARPAAGARVRPRVGGPAAAPLRARSAPSATPRGAAKGGDGRVDDTPHGHRRVILLLGGLALVAVAAIAVLALSGGGGDSPSQVTAGGTPAQTTGSNTSGAAPAHDRTTVAVLNGTTTAGLAMTVAGRLTAAGFVQGAVTNASDQGRSVTVVSYFGGHEREAQEVAQTLDVPADAVQPIDADTEAACAQGATCTAPVVVTVGADRQ